MCGRVCDVSVCVCVICMCDVSVCERVCVMWVDVCVMCGRVCDLRGISVISHVGTLLCSAFKITYMYH